VIKTSVVFLSFLLLCTAMPSATEAQNNPDSTVLKSDTFTLRHSPKKAALFSAVVPGLGQAYNKKYWKMPLIYGGIGVSMYYALQENRDFQSSRKAYKNRLAGDSTDSFTNFSNDNLLEYIDIKRRNRDLLYIVSSLIYVLNIVDASVDAHFFYFDVTDNLSMRWTPSIQNEGYLGHNEHYTKSIKLTLYFN
jgi:hypothetical protein